MKAKADRQMLPIVFGHVVVLVMWIPGNISLGSNSTNRLVRNALFLAGFIWLKEIAMMPLIEVEAQTTGNLVDCTV